MSKGRLYTLIMFFLSFAVVFGGWFLTERMLNYKKAELLGRNGQSSVQSFGLALSAGDDSSDAPEEASGQNDFKGEALSEAMIADILTIWEAGGYELPHEPKEGQMNMGQAISRGEKWISTLCENGVLPSYLAEGNFDKITAKLCTLDVEVTFDAKMISYWEITYATGDVRIILTVHAVSGEIWKANISMNKDRMLFGACSDEELLNIAYPFMKGDNTPVEVINRVICKSFSGGKVFAAVKRDEVVVNKQEPIARLILWLGTAVEKQNN